MKENNDLKRFKNLLRDLFGDDSTSFISFSSLRKNYLSDDFDEFPSDNDKNYNKVVEVNETDTHVNKKETWTSLDGRSTFVRTTSESKLSKSNEVKSKETLENLLNEAITSQNFEEACKIRDEIKKLK